MMPILKYRHECEPIDLMMIIGTVMQYKVLCLFWEVGSWGCINNTTLWGRGQGELFVFEFPFYLGQGM